MEFWKNDEAGNIVPNVEPTPAPKPFSQTRCGECGEDQLSNDDLMVHEFETNHDIRLPQDR